MKYGYIRPIVEDQPCTTQLINDSFHHTYKETHGLAKKRTELEKMLMHVQEKDEIYVQSIQVLADSVQHLMDLLRLAQRDQVVIHFLDEQLTSETIQETTLLESVEFFAHMQSAFLSHSSTFTLQMAKKQGKMVGRPRKSDDNLQKAFAMYDSEEYTLFEIKEATGISKSTLYRYLDERSMERK